MTTYNMMSALGVFGLLFCAWCFSTNRRVVNWRLIFWALALQMAFAFFIFRLPAGVVLFKWINIVIIRILSFTKEGMYFVFGPLAVSPGETGLAGEKSLGFILLFQALPTIIFFSCLMAFLYYIGFMPLVVKFFARIFTKLMKISGAESLCVSSNIFVGIESAFTVRPYIEKMTMSELCTILCAGMATIASSVMAIYVSFLKAQFPAIAGHLISASILSAPAAIVMSKLLFPELDKPQTLGQHVEAHFHKASSWIEAIIKASMEGLKLIGGIVALLLAFLGFLSMLNWAVVGFGHLLNIPFELTIQRILSFIFYPLTFLMGVPKADIPLVACLLGERTIATELVAYQHLDTMIKAGAFSSPRSIVIATYSLCGFAHIASLAIFVGGIAALAPSRSGDLARLGFRALFAATLACLMTGAMAGIFFNANQTILLNLR